MDPDSPDDDEEQDDDDLEMPRNIAPAAMAFEATLAVVAIGLGAMLGHDPTETLDAKVGGSPFVAFLWGVAATLPLVACFFAIDRWPIGPLHDLKELVRSRLMPLFSDASLAQLALLSFAAGVGEELLFRGLLQDGLAMRAGSADAAWTSIVTASLVFGLCHSVSQTYFWLAALVGAYLGLLFWATGSLIAPITAHALYDFVAIAWMVRVGRADEQ